MTVSLLTEGLIGGSASDSSPPVVTAVTPTPNTTPGAGGGMPANYTSARSTPVVVSVTDVDGATTLALISISAVFLDGSVELVYNGSFVGGYAAGSSRSSISNGYQFSIARTSGWPGQQPGGGNLAVGIHIDAVDTGGNLTSTTFYYEMPLQTPVTPSPVVQAAILTARDLGAETRSLIVWQLRS